MLLVLAAFVAVISIVLAGRGSLEDRVIALLSSVWHTSPKPTSFAGGGVPVARASEPHGTSSVDADAGATARAIAKPASPPVRLLIPSLGVNAVVEAVGDDTQGRMAAPSQPERVGWYQAGSRPGDAGSAVLDGHLDWWTGPAVFWHLAKLGPGDEVDVLTADGSQVKFVVDSKAVFQFDASPPGLFTTTGPPSLALVTCYGPWDRQHGTYADRLIVHATLAPPAPPGEGG